MFNPNHVTGERGLIAVDKRGNRILFLDPGTFQTVVTLEGFAPRVHELTISADHLTAFVPIYGDGRHGDNPHPGHLIAKFDLSERRHVGDFSTYPYLAPHSLRWGAGGQLYCVCENSGVILQLDSENGSIVRAIEVGSNKAHRLEITPDGSKAYTENEEDPFCSVVDLRSGRRLREISVPNGTAGIALSPDGSLLVLTDNGRPQIHLVDTARDEIVRAVDLVGFQQPAQIARFSPDGRYLVVTSHSEPLAAIFETAGLDTQKRVNLGKGPMDMGFHPDGRTVLIANHDEGTLAVVDLPRGEVRSTVQAGVGVEVLSFF